MTTTTASPGSTRRGLLANAVFCELFGVVLGAPAAGDVAGWYQTPEQPGPNADGVGQSPKSNYPK